MQDERKIMGEQGLPSSVHVEVVILGAMLLDEVAIMDAADKLEATDFSLDSHQRVYRSIMDMTKAGRAIDYTTVREELSRRKELESIGGPAYLAFLTEGIPRNQNIESYVRIVKDKAILRRAAGIAHGMYVEACDGQEDGLHLVERVIATLHDLGDVKGDGQLERVGTYLSQQGDPEESFTQMATTAGVRLGFSRLDHLTNGLQPKDLIIIGARPSMGKTAFACNIAWNVSVEQGKVVAFFALEQNKQTMIRRMLSSSAQVEYRSILRNTLGPHDKRLLLERRDALSAAPLYIEDASGVTCTRIRSMCMRLKNKIGRLDLVLIDQLSHIPWSDVYEKGLQPPMLIGRQSKFLKRMAKELDVPVVVFNQLKRPDGKMDPKPRLSDLKESGSLEEDADVVGFLHRPEYYNKSDETLKGKGLMILAKNREGATDEVDCEYDGTIMRWTDSVATQDRLDENSRW